MDASEVAEIHPAAISNSPHLLIILFVRIWKGDFVVEVEYRSYGEVRKSLLQEVRNFFRDGFLDLFLDVVPQLMDEDLQIIPQQNSLGQTHLIHGSIDMQHFHQVAALTDMMQFSVLVLLQQSRLTGPDWLVVDVVLTGFAIAVSAQHDLDGKDR